MNIAMIARCSLYQVRGGDTTQVEMTAHELRKLGVNVRIFLACDKIPYQQYDLLHFFNLIRPGDHLYHIRQSGMPYVVSTIYLDYADFDRYGRGWKLRILFRLLGKFRAEYAKNFYRFLRRQDKLISKEYIRGHLWAMREVLEGSSLIMPNSRSELDRIIRDIAYDRDFLVVPNGINQEIFGHIPGEIEREERVLCVGQVYGMKNQLALIEACRSLGVPLDIIGKPPPNHKHYYDLCRSAGDGFVGFMPFLPQPELVRYYARAKVHALPSWFETTGLTSLEAGAMGCNLVVGKDGDTKAYFGEMAHYCDPRDSSSIVTALEGALVKENNGLLREKILADHTWQHAARVTLAGYRRVLNVRA